MPENNYLILVNPHDETRLSIHPDAKPLSVVPALIESFLDRYEDQGYYLNCRQDRIPLDQLEFILQPYTSETTRPVTEEELAEEIDLADCKRDLPHNPFKSRGYLPLMPGEPPFHQSIEERVSRYLCSVGVDATYEYPGFVDIATPDHHEIHAGTVNGHWQCDVVFIGDGDRHGETIGMLELVTRFPAQHVSNGRDIAIEICAAMIVNALNADQKSYGALREGFGSLHDFCDANMLLPGIEDYTADNEHVGDFCNDVTHAVNAVLANYAPIARVRALFKALLSAAESDPDTHAEIEARALNTAKQLGYDWETDASLVEYCLKATPAECAKETLARFDKWVADGNLNDLND